MFSSAWITHPDARYSENRIWLFKKTFTLNEKPARAALCISAEARYKPQEAKELLIERVMAICPNVDKKKAERLIK